MLNKLNKLESLRGFAAFYVILSHSFFEKSLLFQFGQEAVILFFILSGFVIQLAYNRSSNKSFKVFFTKRFLRIYIPLLCVFACNYLLEVYEQNHWLDVEEKRLLFNFFMLQERPHEFFPNSITTGFMNNWPLWSLSYEWWFYMIYIFLAIKFKRQSSTLVYSIGFLSSVAYIFFPSFPLRILMYIVIWWAGGQMAYIYSINKPLNFENIKIPVLVIFGITTNLLLNLFFETNFLNIDVRRAPFLEFRHFSFTLIAIFSAVMWQKARWAGSNKTIGLFEPFATISYGIYISHYFLITEASYLDMINNEFIRFVCYGLICISFSYLIERVIYIKMSRVIMRRLRYSLNSSENIKNAII